MGKVIVKHRKTLGKQKLQFSIFQVQASFFGKVTPAMKQSKDCSK